ncbi:MAG: C-GCAxxG-C-C family protein [Candidatus Bathyarchaeota archaeon]|nr:C-GCAxxG-C-C family protein [Candidatus Bathyarchaeota archaeon]
MSRHEASSKAVSRFLSGYNCAESILLTMAEHQGIESPLIPRIATPFGGGIARNGSICGCVTGALMNIGLKFGRAQHTEDKEKAYAVASSYLGAFEREFGSVICYDLIGCDFRTPEGQKRWEQLKESRCADFVKRTVEILLSLEK